MLSNGCIYVVARLARLAGQWIKRTRNELIQCSIVGWIYVVARLARLARQWIKRTRNELFER